jgi:hypothetical protein
MPTGTRSWVDSSHTKPLTFRVIGRTRPEGTVRIETDVKPSITTNNQPNSATERRTDNAPPSDRPE